MLVLPMGLVLLLIILLMITIELLQCFLPAGPEYQPLLDELEDVEDEIHNIIRK